MSPDIKSELQTAVDKAIAIFEIGNQNPLQKDEIIDMPLTIKQDHIEKQVINTIRDIPDEMYKPPHLLIEPQDKLSVFRQHIPKQQEIDALLQDLRKRVLHNLMVNLDTKDLAERYTMSLRYKDIYNYMTDGSNVSRALQNVFDDMKTILFPQHATENSKVYRNMSLLSKNKAKTHPTKTYYGRIPT